jgi:glycosyltransferase involved in cell wall biosynthesis
MHIGLNAHLLSRTLGYRSAGIHGYIVNLLAHLGAAAPPDWSLTAMIGAGDPGDFDRVAVRRSPMDTDSPLKRIVWEQIVQPWALRPFDLLHSLAFVSPLALTKPSVVTVYDLSFIHYPQALTTARRFYLRWLTALSLRRARRAIAISASTARDLHATLGIPTDKIDIAAPGYDTARFHPLPASAIADFRRRKNLPDRFWLFVGTLEPRKNLTTLLDAYAALPIPDRLPLIIGGGKGWLYDEIFERVDRYRLSDQITFAGFLPVEELALWYNSAEMFVYPSVFEGFGLPVLEAMACGTPVIVADASSLPEVAGQAGIAVPPKDVSAWGDALRRARHDDPWRYEARQRGLIEAARYSWHQTAEKTIASYRTALGHV